MSADDRGKDRMVRGLVAHGIVDMTALAVILLVIIPRWQTFALWQLYVAAALGALYVVWLVWSWTVDARRMRKFLRGPHD